MAVFLKKEPDNQTILGLWEMKEDFAEIRDKVLPYLSVQEKTIYETFRNQKRQMEWLAVRLLLKELIGNFEPIQYDDSGKPFLMRDFNISISHSSVFAGILLSKKKYVGIDIETVSNKIAKIALKFLYPEEIENMKESDKIYSMYVNWCAKEALYKIAHQREVNFRDQIRIAPFHYNQEGFFTGRLITPKLTKEFQMQYFTIQNNIVVWCCE